MAYRLTRQAADDIRKIYATGRRLFGKHQADQYHLHLRDLFEMLGDSPRIARLRPEIVPPVRVHPYGSHLIIYREAEIGGILIVRARHGHENWQA
ncbi:type II toxin-antitoxin system RelE/ParE family toxin [Rhizobium sp. 18055]|uniref:type II toxin-antitoxin system RelE/ParE family toxin n=1 Tax=Rhizobium sp. 18055 TaxID=2681403 RepID=UPI00135A044B|nr:type II toxin-antitoxin system RelE/ParE family toxin [Rhizobium sp. 18055]